MNFTRIFSKGKKFFLLLLILFVAVCIFLDFNKTDVSDVSKEAKDNNCFKKIAKTIQGNSMEPTFSDGEEIVLLENYYKCGYPVQKGDVIAYGYGGNKNPLIKIVQATDADKVEIADNKLEINEEILKNSVGQEFIFTDSQLGMMSLYIKNNHIPKDSFFIFGDNINDSTDSRKFGAVSANDFLGKFVLP